MDTNINNTAEQPVLQNDTILKAALVGSQNLKSSVDISSKATATVLASHKTLKRCLSVPSLPGAPVGIVNSMTTRSAAAAAMGSKTQDMGMETPKKYLSDNTTSNFANIHINIPRSSPSSREVSPAPVFNIFAPRARRYSASYSPAISSLGGAPLCVTPRVSQLRQEECVDINSREVNHEREVHCAMQMSQSWEDLTLVAENWSCKSDEFSNPLQVVLPSSATGCSSPSPTSTRAGLRHPYGPSPSPTRRTYATRRSMSPIAMRPSQLGPVKRKFELDDNPGNWSTYSSPPIKKIFTESRGNSPGCQSPSSICPSPESGTCDGRITPKLFISKLCTNNNANGSACSSPSPINNVHCNVAMDVATNSVISSSSSTSSVSAGSEPMSVSSSIDEGISISETEDKISQCSNNILASSRNTMGTQLLATDMHDEATLIDDIKSETSSIGGCSSISVDSMSCDGAMPGAAPKSTATFLNKLIVDEANMISLGQKNFFINKQGLSGSKKFIVNHENLAASTVDNSGIDRMEVVENELNVTPIQNQKNIEANLMVKNL